MGIIDAVIKVVPFVATSGMIYLLLDVIRFITMSKIEEVLTPDRTKFRVEFVTVVYVMLTTFLYFYVGKPTLDITTAIFLLSMGVLLTLIVIIGYTVVKRIMVKRVRYVVVLDNHLYFIIKAIDKDIILLKNCFTNDFRKVESKTLTDVDFKEFRGLYYYLPNGNKLSMNELLQNMITH